jgi:hypothetical protein
VTADNWTRVKAILEAKGVLTNGVGRAVQATACPRCHARTLTAYAGDIAQVLVKVDPEPLSPLGEALALLAGRYTCSLWRAGNRYELDLRDSFHIRTPAGSGKCDVHAEHRCGAPPLPSIKSQFPARSRTLETTCPF